ncbi:MAG: hypothetical protein JO166_09000 [Deltaproteobacteria bacterium]|nr:hypothetical protein [Deltaproteobacteria bacterium]
MGTSPNNPPLIIIRLLQLAVGGVHLAARVHALDELLLPADLGEVIEHLRAEAAATAAYAT